MANPPPPPPPLFSPRRLTSALGFAIVGVGEEEDSYYFSRTVVLLLVLSMASGSENTLKRSRPTRYRSAGASTSQGPSEQLQTALQEVGQSSNPPVPAAARGPHQIADTHVEDSHKPEVWPVGVAEFDSNPKVTNLVVTINKLALNNTPGPFRSLHSWPKRAKENFEEDFLDRFRYRENIDPGLCHEVLEAIGAKGYTAGLGRCRKQYKKKYGADPKNWKRKVPTWCKKNETWEGFCDIWSSKRWKDLSARNKQNRGKKVGHCGGSASAYQHSLRLKKTLGREPTYAELYLELHATKGGQKKGKGKAKQVSEEVAIVNEDEAGGSQESLHASGITESLIFVDDKSRDVYEKAMKLRDDPANSDKGENRIWVMAGGGPSHGRVYGFGGKIDKSDMQTSSTHSRPVCYLPPRENVPLKVYSAEEVEAIIEAREQRFREECAARERADAERNKRNDMLFAQLYAVQGWAMPTLEVMRTEKARRVREDVEIHEHRMEAAEVADDVQEANDTIQPGLDNWFANTGFDPKVIFKNV